MNETTHRKLTYALLCANALLCTANVWLFGVLVRLIAKFGTIDL